MKNKIHGIAFCNPVDLDRDYMLFTADYAITHGVNHYQIVGPIHNPEKGNIDGMTLYRKYADFNNEKKIEYVRFCEKTVNEVCEKLSANSIRSYMWHHELEVPENFKAAYPEILNEYGEVEITHPIIKDFLENKIKDFFAAYPKIDGIILTLHETRIPLLKLTHQKLSKVERVKYVTEILYNTCRDLGHELIVRPFASVEEDYELMTKAYEQISDDMLIMDKWTQFDWSLTLPANRFFKKINKNPLLVETDIFGEYFGLGILPIMLKHHIKKNFTYSENFTPIGYMSRIDRAGYHAFKDVNEVNYHIMAPYQSGSKVDEAIDNIFNERYGEAGAEIRNLMENTEDIQRRIFYLNNYYFTEGSRFPRLNHSKNHFYFEIMKEEHYLESGEWFIPKNKWERGDISELRREKASAATDAKASLLKLKSLKNKLSENDFTVLEGKFLNLYYVALAWKYLTEVFISYTKYFETVNEDYEKDLFDAFAKLEEINTEASEKLGQKYYINALVIDQLQASSNDIEPILAFIRDTKASFIYEKEAVKRLKSEKLTDFIVCGGATEGHHLKKEVNFSDTFVLKDGVCRIPGTNRGKVFSAVNTHGWFGYELSVRPNSKNKISVTASSDEKTVHFKLTLGNTCYEIKESCNSKKEFIFVFEETDGADKISLRIDRLSGYTPYIYEIKCF